MPGLASWCLQILKRKRQSTYGCVPSAHACGLLYNWCLGHWGWYVQQGCLFVSLQAFCIWVKSEGKWLGYRTLTITGKLQNLPEIHWFVWVFLVGLCCIVWWNFTIEKMPKLRWSVLARNELFQDLSLIWSITIPVKPKCLQSSSLSKQKFFR